MRLRAAFTMASALRSMFSFSFSGTLSVVEMGSLA